MSGRKGWIFLLIKIIFSLNDRILMAACGHSENNTKNFLGGKIKCRSCDLNCQRKTREFSSAVNNLPWFSKSIVQVFIYVKLWVLFIQADVDWRFWRCTDGSQRAAVMGGQGTLVRHFYTSAYLALLSRALLNLTRVGWFSIAIGYHLGTAGVVLSRWPESPLTTLRVHQLIFYFFCIDCNFRH